MKNLYRASQKITIILGVVVVLIIACFLIVQPRIRIDQVESVVLYGYGQEYRTSDPEMIKRISGIIDDAFFFPVPFGNLFYQSLTTGVGVTAQFEYFDSGVKKIHLPMNSLGILGGYTKVDFSLLEELLISLAEKN